MVFWMRVKMPDVEKVIAEVARIREYYFGEMTSYEGDALDAALALLKERYVPDCNAANHDGNGCLGYGYDANDDEPIPICRDCKKYTSYVKE